MKAATIINDEMTKMCVVNLTIFISPRPVDTSRPSRDVGNRVQDSGSDQRVQPRPGRPARLSKIADIT
jgi:hypothetical protein